MELRSRNVAHAWWDKRVMRLFRKYFPKKLNQKLRTVYIALCEIESDFTEGKAGEDGILRALSNTVATYTGMDRFTMGKSLMLLREMKIIDYGYRRTQRGGRVIGSWLKMGIFVGDSYHFNEKVESWMSRNLHPSKSTPVKNKNAKASLNENPFNERKRFLITPFGVAAFDKDRLKRKEGEEVSLEGILQSFYRDSAPFPCDLTSRAGTSLDNYIKPFQHMNAFDQVHESYREDQYRGYYEKVISRNWKSKRKLPGEGFKRSFLRFCRSGVAEAAFGLEIIPKEQWKKEQSKGNGGNRTEGIYGKTKFTSIEL